MAILCAVTVRAQNTAGGAEPSAAPPASPDHQLVSSDQPIAETPDSSQGEPEDPVEKRAKVGLVIGPKLGASFGQVFSDLGTSFIGELEIGYLLPLPPPIGRSFELFVSLQYTQPTLDGKTSNTDPRLPDEGTMSYQITQQQLLLTPGVLFRIPLGSEVGALLRPYTALGARVYML